MSVLGSQEYAMQTHRFGRRLKLPATIVIKRQIRKLTFEDLVKEAEAIARAEAIRPLLSEEPLLMQEEVDALGVQLAEEIKQIGQGPAEPPPCQSRGGTPPSFGLVMANERKS